MACIPSPLLQSAKQPEALAAAVKKEESASEADGRGVVVGSVSTAVNKTGGPPSTGTGDGVETVPALVASLVRLAEAPPILPPPAKEDGASGSAQPKKEEEDIAAMDTDGVDNDAAGVAAYAEEDERREAQYVQADLFHLSRSAASVASRADALRNALVPLLRHALSSASATVEKLAAVDPLLDPSSLRRDIAALQNQMGEKESKLAELTFAREEAAKGERRVRRGLYRLASGRMKLSDVIKVCVCFAFGLHWFMLLRGNIEVKFAGELNISRFCASHYHGHLPTRVCDIPLSLLTHTMHLFIFINAIGGGNGGWVGTVPGARQRGGNDGRCITFLTCSGVGVGVGCS